MKFRVLLLSVIFVTFGAVSANAAGADISFDKIPSPVSVGQIFSLNVRLTSNDSDIDTIRISADFDSAILNAEYINLTELFPNISPASTIDNVKGSIYYGGFRTSGPTGQSGVIAKIVFMAKKSGTVKVSLNSGTKAIGTGEEKFSGDLNFASIEVSDKNAIENNNIAYFNNIPVLTISSDTNSEQNKWYQSNDVNFSWTKPLDLVVDNYYYDFDNSPDTDPKKILSSDKMNLAFQDLADGIWYLHVKAKLSDGKYTNVAHYQAKIDVNPPNKFQPLFENVEIMEGEKAILRFGTIDQTSGVDHYDVQVGEKVFKNQVSPMEISDLPAGDSTIYVVAYDKANNTLSSDVFVRVNESSQSQGEVKEKQTETKSSNIYFIVKIIGILALILVIIFMIFRKFSSKKN